MAKSLYRGDRVNHQKYGKGTIKYIMFEGTFRETYLVEFDVSNSELHDGYDLVKEHHGYCCSKEQLEVIND